TAHVVPGAEIRHRWAVGHSDTIAALEHEVNEARDVRRVRARRWHANRVQPILLSGFGRLIVEVPQHFHVVTHEPDRDDGDRKDATGWQFCDRIIDIRLKPRHAGRAGT